MDTQIPRIVYRLMSITGATRSQALLCWKISKGDFCFAIQIYEEKILKAETALEPPSEYQSHKKEHVERDINIWNPGVHFVKGVLIAVAVLAAVEAL